MSSICLEHPVAQPEFIFFFGWGITRKLASGADIVQSQIKIKNLPHISGKRLQHLPLRLRH